MLSRVMASVTRNTPDMMSTLMLRIRLGLRKMNMVSRVRLTLWR